MLSLPTTGYSIDAIWSESTSNSAIFNNKTNSAEVFAAPKGAYISNSRNSINFPPGLPTGVLPLEDAFLVLFFSVATYGAYVYRKRRERR